MFVGQMKYLGTGEEKHWGGMSTEPGTRRGERRRSKKGKARIGGEEEGGLDGLCCGVSVVREHYQGWLSACQQLVNYIPLSTPRSPSMLIANSMDGNASPDLRQREMFLFFLLLY